ncbi:MAG: alcohol dehydrogenase catalytic domain-containing protein [Cyclobacteriaceae bacterium]
MKTIVLNEPGKLSYTDTPQNEDLQADEALVKVHRIGICGTDFHAYRGRQPFFTYPRILGHELGVEVLEVGEEGSINIDLWVTHRSTFEEMVDQFDHWLEPNLGVIKAGVSV